MTVDVSFGETKKPKNELSSATDWVCIGAFVGASIMPIFYTKHFVFAVCRRVRWPAGWLWLVDWLVGVALMLMLMTTMLLLLFLLLLLLLLLLLVLVLLLPLLLLRFRLLFLLLVNCCNGGILLLSTL